MQALYTDLQQVLFEITSLREKESIALVADIPDVVSKAIGES